ncbi:type IV pilus modification protein PilV [Hahella ganghwensis]|uniref:type IV pilus modification protein PilV n=1 Tax=Hahella ganghwensis TaxID=286420 RepID=UPI00037C6A1C|nr:type IV pilus modification protein PilV [Hahella ganghwensis]
MSISQHNMQILKAQKGLGLIEVLVTVLILAVGLLGIAALQAKSLKNNAESYYRTQATVLATDLADRVRSNRAILDTFENAYDMTFATSKTITTTKNCETAACSESDLAEYDKVNWVGLVIDNLPGGEAQVTTDEQTDGSFLVKIEIQYDLDFGQSTSSNKPNFEYMTKIL